MTSPWLVTGSSGFLGSNTGIWLADKVSTVGISRDVSGPSSFGIQKAIEKYVINKKYYENIITLVDNDESNIYLGIAYYIISESFQYMSFEY